MPKRIGSGLLGYHDCLLSTTRQAHTLLLTNSILHNIMLLLILPLYQHWMQLHTRAIYVDHSVIIGALLIYPFISLLTQACATAATIFCHGLEPAPPWNLNHTLILYFPRHFRKHGRYKFLPRYPTIRRQHLWMLSHLLLTTPSTACAIDSRLSTQLRHTQWGSDTQQHWYLPYYDVDMTASGDPSRVMRMFRQHSPTWNSTNTTTFKLDDAPLYLPLPEDDPSEIMHIFKFGCQCVLTREDAPLFYTLKEDNHSCYVTNPTSSAPPLIADTGASICITPLWSDFVSYYPSRLSIKDLSSSNKVSGEGLIHWHVVDRCGNNHTLTVQGCHIPQAEVRLFSPQTLLRQAGGHLTVTSNKLTLHLADGTILDAPFCPKNNLPCFTMAGQFDPQQTNFWTSTFDFSQDQALTYPALLTDDNTNLNAAQQELLLWHHRLSHASLGRLQLLTRDRAWLHDRDTNKSHALYSGPFLPCTTKARTCDIQHLKCIACCCAKAQRRSTSAVKRRDPDILQQFEHTLDGVREKVLKTGHLQPGDCISADHYLSPHQGRLYTTFGKERHGYTCGTLFVDHASGKVFNCLQLSTTAAETIESKHALERLAFDEGIKIKSYHSDNGVFASDAFRSECYKSSQKLTFSGVGAHHQNGIAERNIKTISHWARTNMLHAAFHWPEHASIKLWPQAVDYAVWVFNRLPSITTGLSPNELWSSTRSSNHDLCRARPFGCPVFVLDPALQDGGKIPKWDARARRGMFVGFSNHHSSLVPLCLNLRTGKITPQFHVVFDEKFHTVASVPKGTSLHDQWSSILQFDRDCFYDIDDDLAPNGGPPLPQEFVNWFDNTDHVDASPIDRITPDETPNIQIGATPPFAHEHDTNPEESNDSEGDNISEGEALESEGDAIGRPSRTTKSWKDGPANIRKFPIDGEEYDFTFTVSSSGRQSTSS